MDPRIRNLSSTTFGGVRLSRHEIAEIQETVQFFPALSRTELVRTVCVQMDWHAPGGAPSLGLGLRVLRDLQRSGIIRLPPKRSPGRGPQKPLYFDRRTAPRPPPRAAADDDFLDMWRDIVGSVARAAAAHDRRWQRRRRSIRTMLVVLFVFRLARTPRQRGYVRVLADLWECCRRLGLELPQPRPVAASSMSAARAKVGGAVFERIHATVLRYANRDRSTLWKGLRAFAVDGSKLNLPQELAQEGYCPPSPQAQCPQGLLSCLYQIGRCLPLNFALHAHLDERRAALQHLATIGPGDLVVYDHGYFSFSLLRAHSERQVEAVFRLQRNASGSVRDFVVGSSSDEVVTVEPNETARRRWPGAELPPCRLRMVKYAIDGTVYALGTTLLDAERYPVADLADLYHGRWSVEELFKISGELLAIESFHSRSERTVKQELYAHFTLIAMAWLFASSNERQFESRAGEAGQPPRRADFNHSLDAVERELKALLLHQAPQLRNTLNHVL